MPHNFSGISQFRICCELLSVTIDFAIFFFMFLNFFVSETASLWYLDAVNPVIVNFFSKLKGGFVVPNI